MACNNLSRVTEQYLDRYYGILDCMISGMTEACLNESISHNFIVQMIPHHRAAIEMSENILQYTTFIPLQNIAESIIKEQTKSICDMEEALPSCTECINQKRELCMYQRRFEIITDDMFGSMSTAPRDNNINIDFMREMIPHHEGAVRMSKNALDFSLCNGLIPILKSIIASQEEGIREMKYLLKRC